MPITHTKVSELSDSSDVTLIQPSDWNENHTVDIFEDDIIPTGAVNGSNLVFTLPSTPSPASSLKLYYNGILQRRGTDYTLATATITTVFTAQTGDDLRCDYRKA